MSSSESFSASRLTEVEIESDQIAVHGRVSVSELPEPPTTPSFTSELRFQQYKLYVETAEHNSDRRISTQRFYTTIHTSLLTVVGIVGSYGLLNGAAGGDAGNQHVSTTGDLLSQIQGPLVLAVCIIGSLLAFLWRSHLQSFRFLSGAKFQVIHAIEGDLPYQPFKDEWTLLKGAGKKKRYVEFTTLERIIPMFALSLYVIVAVLYFCVKPHWTNLLHYLHL